MGQEDEGLNLALGKLACGCQPILLVPTRTGRQPLARGRSLKRVKGWKNVWAMSVVAFGPFYLGRLKFSGLSCEGGLASGPAAGYLTIFSLSRWSKITFVISMTDRHWGP